MLVGVCELFGNLRELKLLSSHMEVFYFCSVNSRFNFLTPPAYTHSKSKVGWGRVVVIFTNSIVYEIAYLEVSRFFFLLPFPNILLSAALAALSMNYIGTKLELRNNKIENLIKLSSLIKSDGCKYNLFRSKLFHIVEEIEKRKAFSK